MTENAYVYIIAPLVTAIIAGIGWLVKYILAKRDKRHEEEIEERNKRRSEIEERLTKSEQRQERTDKKLNNLMVAVAGCEKEDCPTRKKLGALMNINQTYEHGEA